MEWRLQPDDVRNSGAQYRGFRIAANSVSVIRTPFTQHSPATMAFPPEEMRGQPLRPLYRMPSQGFNFCADIASQRGIYLFNQSCGLFARGR